MTNLLLVGAALALLFFATRLRARSRAAALVLCVAAVLVAFFAAVRVGRRAVAGPAALTLRNTETIAGAMLAEQVATDLPQGGKLLLLRHAPTTVTQRDVTAFRARGFRRAIGSAFSIVEAGPDPWGGAEPPPTFERFGSGLVRDEVAMLRARHPDAVALVSLLPTLPPADPAAGHLPVYGFDGGPDRQWARQMPGGRLRAAVLYTATPSPLPSRPADLTRQEIFDLFFTLVTPANFRQVLADVL